MDELFDSVSRPSNLQCHWQVGWPRPIVCHAYKFCLMVTYFHCDVRATGPELH